MYIPNIPRYDLTIPRGTDFSQTFDIDIDGVILNITGYTIQSSISTKPDGSGTAIIDFTVAANTTSNEVTLSLTDVQTAAIADSVGYYDVLLTDSYGDSTYYLQGRIDFTGKVTQLVPSSVVITSPADGATVSSPVTIDATATTGTGRTITNVKFYGDGTLLNTDTSAPYSYAWTTAAGSHTIYATVTDDKSTYTSDTITITVS